MIIRLLRRAESPQIFSFIYLLAVGSTKARVNMASQSDREEKQLNVFPPLAILSGMKKGRLLTI